MGVLESPDDVPPFFHSEIGPSEVDDQRIESSTVTPECVGIHLRLKIPTHATNKIGTLVWGTDGDPFRGTN